MVEIAVREHKSKYHKITLSDEEGNEVGHGFLFIISNEGHDRPYGLMERLFIEEDQRGKGYGRKLVEELISLAKKLDCYKIVGTSRYANEHVHKLYEKYGFEDHGKSFRMDLTDEGTSI